MTDTDAPRPAFEITDFRFRPSMILIVIAAGVLMEAMLRLGRMPAKWLYLNGPESWDGRIWIYVGLAILCQALVGLIGILIMKRVLPQADAHLRWPPGRSYIGLAIALGVAMGLIMLIADYGPLILSGAEMPVNYPASNALDVAGWLGAMGITGLAEETIFRGLMVGALLVLIPGCVRLWNIDLPLAGVIVALLFCAAHWKSFVVDPLPMAIAQQSYAFVWGLVYVWLMERSRSLVAPIVAHGLGNATEVGLVILMVSMTP